MFWSVLFCMLSALMIMCECAVCVEASLVEEGVGS